MVEAGYRSGSDVEIVARLPSHFSEADLGRFRELVVEGGEVGGAKLTVNIARARILVVAMQAGKICGATALKRPQQTYRNRVATQAGVKLAQEDYPFELGYVYLEPILRRRGLSHRMVASALQHCDAGGVFATVRVDNLGMRATLATAGFAAVGSDYPGAEGRRIGLLIRQA